MVLMDQSIEALVDSLSDHLTSWDKLSVEFVKNILQIVSLYTFLRIEKFQEFLDKLRSNVNLQRLDISSFVDDQLKEELIDALQVRPTWIDLFLLLNTSFRESKSPFLNIGKRPEDVLLNHLHHLIEIWND